MITNYLTLKTAVRLWKDREDLVPLIPEFVALAESDIRRVVKVRDMLTTQSGALVDSLIPEPDRMIEIRRLKVDGELVDMPDWRMGSTGIQTPTGSTYELEYWRYYSAMTQDTDTNWLLIRAPDLYLFATKAYACDFLRDEQGYQLEMQKFSARAAEVNRIYKPIPTGGVQTIRARGVV